MFVIVPALKHIAYEEFIYGKWSQGKSYATGMRNLMNGFGFWCTERSMRCEWFAWPRLNSTYVNEYLTFLQLKWLFLGMLWLLCECVKGRSFLNVMQNGLRYFRFVWTVMAIQAIISKKWNPMTSRNVSNGHKLCLF